MTIKYILDYSAAKTLLLSSDAYYYLTVGEEPLDETNLIEANKVSELFPYGFEADESSFKAIPEKGLISIKLIPYKPDDADYDEFCQLGKYVQYQIKWRDSGFVQLWRAHSEKATREMLGEFEVLTNAYGKKYIATGDYTHGKGCLFFLKDFIKK